MVHRHVIRDVAAKGLDHEKPHSGLHKGKLRPSDVVGALSQIVAEVIAENPTAVKSAVVRVVEAPKSAAAVPQITVEVNPRDDLDAYISDRSKRDPELPDMIEAAMERASVVDQAIMEQAIEDTAKVKQEKKRPQKKKEIKDPDAPPAGD